MEVSMSLENGSSIPKKSIRNNHPIEDCFLPGEALIQTDASWGKFTTLGAGTGIFTLVKLLRCETAERYIPALCKAGYQLIPLGGGANFAGSDAPLNNTLFLKAEDGVFHFLREEENGHYSQTRSW